MINSSAIRGHNNPEQRQRRADLEYSNYSHSSNQGYQRHSGSSYERRGYHHNNHHNPWLSSAAVATGQGCASMTHHQVWHDSGNENQFRVQSHSHQLKDQLWQVNPSKQVADSNDTQTTSATSVSDPPVQHSSLILDYIQGHWFDSQSSISYEIKGYLCTEPYSGQFLETRLVTFGSDLYRYTMGRWHKLGPTSFDATHLVWRQVSESDWKFDSSEPITWKRAINLSIEKECSSQEDHNSASKFSQAVEGYGIKSSFQEAIDKSLKTYLEADNISDSDNKIPEPSHSGIHSGYTDESTILEESTVVEDRYSTSSAQIQAPVSSHHCWKSKQVLNSSTRPLSSRDFGSLD